VPKNGEADERSGQDSLLSEKPGTESLTLAAHPNENPALFSLERGLGAHRRGAFLENRARPSGL